MGFQVFHVHPTVVLVLLSTSVERIFVSRMHDFFLADKIFRFSSFRNTRFDNSSLVQPNPEKKIWRNNKQIPFFFFKKSDLFYLTFFLPKQIVFCVLFCQLRRLVFDQSSPIPLVGGGGGGGGKKVKNF